MKKLCLILSILFLCTSVNSDNDPLEDINRTTLLINQKLDKVIATPVAKFYGKITPDIVEIGIYNAISNIDDINISINNILQGKFKEGFSDILRFTINSSIGIGGLLDVASRMGFKKHDEDFGQTLAVWGFDEGPYIVLPGLGPSTLRDTLAMIPDSFLTPLWLIDHDRTSYSLTAIDLVDTRARYLGLESVVIGDEYLFYKDAYLQSREFEIKDGEIEDDFDEFDDFN